MREEAMKSLLANLSVFTEALGGLNELRRVILTLAIRGQLEPQGLNKSVTAGDEHASYQATLGELCNIYQPKTISTSEMKSDGQYPVYGANGIIGRYDKYNHQESEVLVTCRGATCGRVNVSLPMSWINGNAMVVSPKNTHLIKTYLAIVLRGLDYASIISGTAQPQITKQPLSKISILVPSLDVQSETVAKVDELMALCDQLEEAQTKRDSIRTATRKSAIDAVATASTSQELEVAWNRISSHWYVMANTPESVEDLRRLIIDLAIHGQLLAKQEIGNHGYPTDWEISDFASICDIEGGNQPPKSTFISEPKEGYVQLFQIRDLGSNPIPVYIPSEFARSTSVEGEILIGRYGASVGKIFRAREGAYNVALVKFIFPKEKLDSEFVYWFLKSTRSQILFTGMSRSAQAGFNKKDLGPLVIPIPGKDEQAKIVYRLNTLLEVCDNLEQALIDSSLVASKFSRSIVSFLP